MIDIIREGYFPDTDSFVQWWYDSNNQGLGKSPYEVCKEGKQEELESILRTPCSVLTAAKSFKISSY